MARQRKDEYTYEVIQEATFSTEPTWTTGLKVGTVGTVDLSSVRNAEIDDPSYVTDGGAHESIEGVAYSEVSVPLSVKAEGIQAVSADGDAAVATAQSLLMGCVMGQVPTLTKRTKTTAAAQSTTSVIEDVDDGHLPGLGTDSIGLAAFARAADSTVLVRPYKYVAASDTMTLLMALPNAQASSTDIIYGGSLTQFVQRPVYSTTPPSLSMRFLGNDALQNRSLQGVVGVAEVPEFGAQDVPMINTTLSAGDMQRNVAFDANSRAALTQTAPTNPRGRVFAGSQVLLSKYGATTTYAVPSARIGWTIGQGWMATEDPNGADGIRGWDRAKGSVTVTLTLPHDILPSAVTGISSTSWYAAWSTGGAESKFHLLVSIGQNTPGSGNAWYFPALRLLRPDDADVNEQDARTLRFTCATPLLLAAPIEVPAVHLMW